MCYFRKVNVNLMKNFVKENIENDYKKFYFFVMLIIYFYQGVIIVVIRGLYLKCLYIVKSFGILSVKELYIIMCKKIKEFI